MANFGTSCPTPDGNRHFRPLTFCTQFIAEQLLFEVFLDIMSIFGSVQPQSESTSHF